VASDPKKCARCGRRPRKAGCVRCVVCLAGQGLAQNRLYARRRNAGLCPGCGNGRPLEGRWGCGLCMERHRTSAREWKRRQAAGKGAT
jgi:hypothetical protein